MAAITKVMVITVVVMDHMGEVIPITKVEVMVTITRDMVMGKVVMVIKTKAILISNTRVNKAIEALLLLKLLQYNSLRQSAF